MAVRAYTEDKNSPPLSPLDQAIGKRLGVLPNFFRLAPEVPAIGEALWGFATFAYLDSPLPSLFKERLFVHLSRFCEVRYCLARHLGFLVGRGRPSGDGAASPMSSEQAIAVLKRSFLPHMNAGGHLSFLRGVVGPLEGDIAPDSEVETALFALATSIYLDPAKSRPFLAVLRRVLGIERYEYLLAFVGFIHMAHYWTQVHPDLREEEDLLDLMNRLEDLSWALAWDTQCWSAVASQVSEELGELRALLAKGPVTKTAPLPKPK